MPKKRNTKPLQSQRTPPFLRLPPEIHRHILGYLLVSSVEIGYRGRSRERLGLHPAILAANHELHRVGKDLLYQANTFRLTLSVGGDRIEDPKLRAISFLGDLPAKRKVFDRLTECILRYHITIEAPFNHTPGNTSMGQAICNLATRFSSIQRIICIRLTYDEPGRDDQNYLMLEPFARLRNVVTADISGDLPTPYATYLKTLMEGRAFPCRLSEMYSTLANVNLCYPKLRYHTRLEHEALEAEDIEKLEVVSTKLVQKVKALRISRRKVTSALTLASHSKDHHVRTKSSGDANV